MPPPLWKRNFISLGWIKTNAIPDCNCSMSSHNGKDIFSNLMLFFCIGTEAYVSFKVRANPDNTSLDSHLEGEADDSSNLQ